MRGISSSHQVSAVSAAYTLAGNIAISRKVRSPAAGVAVLRRSRARAATISAMPVTVTSSPGAGEAAWHHGDEFVAHADEVGSPGQQEHDRQSAAQRGGQPSEAVDPARSDDQREAGGADESDERFHGAGIPSGSGWW